MNLIIYSFEKVIDVLEIILEEFFNFDSFELIFDKSDNFLFKRINMKIK